jgi:hypothetical protein
VTGLGTYDYYPPSGQLIWSNQTRRHFGLPPGAPATYDTFLAGLHHEDRERVLNMLQATLAKGSDGIFNAEYRTIGIEDGTLRWLTARGRAF